MQIFIHEIELIMLLNRYNGRSDTQNDKKIYIHIPAMYMKFSFTFTVQFPLNRRHKSEYDLN